MNTRPMSLCVALFVSAGLAASAMAQVPANPPVPQVPAGTDVFGNPNAGPGAWPVSISAANWFNRLPANTVNGRFGSNAVIVNRLVSGPDKWTSGNVNEGDWDFAINPPNPTDPKSYPTYQPYDAFRETDGNPNPPINPLPASIDTPASQWPDTQNWGRFRMTGGKQFAPVNFGWGVHPAIGVVIATVANNGRDNQNFNRNDLVTPVGVAYGHAHVTEEGGDSTGRAYSPITGQFRGTGMYISAYAVGTRPNDQDELVIDWSAAYFPYAQGWTGGYYDPSASAFRQRDGLVCASPNLTPFVVTQLSTDFANYTLTLPGVTPADGMLFVQNCNDNNDTEISNGLATDTGWNITCRFDGDVDPSGSNLIAFNDGNSRFTFVYVPYNTQNLVGGRINGATGDTVRGAGNYTMTRTGTGVYELRIPGASTETGALILGTAGACPGDATLADNAFMNYEYFPETETFVINARVLDRGTNLWGESYPTRDADFYFMFVDFANPPAPPSACTADFNGDTVLNADDLGDFITGYFNEPPDARCDFNGDTVINADDIGDFITAYFNGC